MQERVNCSATGLVALECPDSPHPSPSIKSARMASVEVIPVRTAAERRRFLELPWKLYRRDPHWIPPLRGNQAELVGFKKHPFHDDAIVQPFIAMQGGECVGRIAAIVDHAHNRYYEEQRGFWGFCFC